ncbi:MAG: M55 family metallopeptidase [Candidatus Excrementavichristensenella sp.]|jgi:D-amino peptidase
MAKIYLVSDIEGSCGFTIPEEGTVGTPWYPYFAKQMSLEAAAACRGAFSAGADDILVHDAHGTARNIDPCLLPENARLMRRSGADPYAMVSGLQSGDYDALFLTGFHSWAGSVGSPASHTFNHRTTKMTLNDVPLSEFLFDCYSAASLGVPTPFISGDKNICEFAKMIIPGIISVCTLEGVGAGSVSPHPVVALKRIEAGAAEALHGDYRLCMPILPKRFKLRICFIDHVQAEFNSFYPDMRRIDDCTLEYEAEKWYDILVMVHFVLDK